LCGPVAYAIAVAGLPLYPFPLLGLPLYPVILVYGILRYGVFVANAWARRALVWTLLLALGAVVVALTPLLPFESRWLGGLAVAASCLALNGPIRGFAVTLTLGIMTTVYTAFTIDETTLPLQKENALGVPGAQELMPFLLDAYRMWGGKGYYVTNPPQHSLKRWVARGALKVGGLAVLHWLLKQASQPRRAQRSDMALYGIPSTDADKSDVASIRTLDEA